MPVRTMTAPTSETLPCDVCSTPCTVRSGFVAGALGIEVTPWQRWILDRLPDGSLTLDGLTGAHRCVEAQL